MYLHCIVGYSIAPLCPMVYLLSLLVLWCDAQLTSARHQSYTERLAYKSKLCRISLAAGTVTLAQHATQALIRACCCELHCFCELCCHVQSSWCVRLPAFFILKPANFMLYPASLVSLPSLQVVDMPTCTAYLLPSSSRLPEFFGCLFRLSGRSYTEICTKRFLTTPGYSRSPSKSFKTAPGDLNRTFSSIQTM